MDDVTPQQAADVLARIQAIRMEQAAGALRVGAAAIRASISVRLFAEALTAGENAEFWEHPDVLETNIMFDSWYPEAPRG